MVGLPIVGLATTEMSVAIQNGISGYIHTNVDYLIEKMNHLITDPTKAMEMSKAAKAIAQERFNIDRFANDWLTVITKVCSRASKENVNTGGVL